MAKENSKKQIDYNILLQNHPYHSDKIDVIVDMIREVYFHQEPRFRIGQERILTDLLVFQFRKLDFTHVEYVLECLEKVNHEIKNIKAYITKALYNAPMTISTYYSNQVRKAIDNKTQS